MYIFKNALKSITRSKGRNILIGIIIVIIAISSCVALSIKNAAAEIVISYRENFVLTATIGLDRKTLQSSAQTGGADIRELMTSIKTPTIEDIKNYGTSDNLKGYTYTLSSSVNSTTLVPLSNETVTPTVAASTSTATSSKAATTKNNQPNQNFDRQGGQFARGDFTIVGYSGMSAMTNFVSGTYQITSGAMFEDTDQSAACVISEELATQNSVAVGDVISLSNPSVETEIYEFTIVGLYKDTTTDDSSSMNWFSNSANQIITNYTSLANVVSLSQIASDKSIADAAATAASTSTTTTATAKATTLNAQLSSTFMLKTTSSVAPFTAELKTKGLNEYYTVITNTSGFDESVKPLTNLDSFATIFLLLVLLIGGIILSVLNMINIRERKYEVGVLRAIGMKKGKLAMQFVAELLMVTFVCIIIGSVAGAVASVPTASMLLKNEVNSMQTADTQVAQNFGRPGGTGNGMPGRAGTGIPGGAGGPGGGRDIMGGAFNPAQKVNYVTQINAVINIKVLMQLFLIGILLTIISSIISVILISRYEPLKILSNRS